MHKANRMTQAPAQCLYCNRGNVPDDGDTMDTMWFLDLERDVNWGDPTYVCKYCCEKIGIMAGLVGMQELKESQDLNRSLRKKIHDLEAKLAQKRQRLERITGGARALKKEKQDAAKHRAESVEELRAKAKRKAKKRVAADV